MKRIETLTAADAAEILRGYGMSISPATIRQRVYNGHMRIGDANMRDDGGIECTVYRKLLDQWIEERAVEVESNGLSGWRPKEVS